MNPLNSSQADCLNDYPSIIYFVDSETKDEAKAVLEAIAKPYIASDPDPRVHFFYHTHNEDEEDIKSSLLSFANIEGNHNLLFIDVPSQSVCVCVCEVLSL